MRLSKKPQRTLTICRSLRGKQSGFALLVVILIAVVLIIAGGVGYYFYKSSSTGKYSSPEKTYSLFIKAMEKRDAQRIIDLMRTLRTGILEFNYDQRGGYPVLSDTSEDGEFLKVLVDKGYLTEMLLDPLHPEYFYEYEGTENSYTLKSYCEIEGGDCDMADGVKDHVLIYSSP